MTRPDLSEILRANPQIDLKRVEQFEAYRTEMSKAGVDLSPAYRVAPPLGEPGKRREQTHARRQHLFTSGLR